MVPSLGAGGTEHVVNLLANHWASIGHAVFLITLDPNAAVPYYPTDPKVKAVSLDLPPRKTSAPRALWLASKRILAIRRTLKSIKPDVVVSFLTRTNVLTLIAKIGIGVPVIVSERNNPAQQRFGTTWETLRGILYPRAFGLITMTVGAMNYFPLSMRRRSWVIPNAVELPRFQRSEAKANRLVAVGRLVPQKGFDLLIEAFATIEKKHPDWQLVIWGEGPDRKTLEARRDARGLTDRIAMPGVSERPGSWLETADAFVLSSRFEGWGIVLLEAMAWGLPCVSFDCEWGPGEMIQNEVDGILVPRDDVGALARQLSRVMSDGELRRRLAEAAKISTQRFSHAQVMAAWDGVIEDALAERHVNVEFNMPALCPIPLCWLMPV